MTPLLATLGLLLVGLAVTDAFVTIMSTRGAGPLTGLWTRAVWWLALRVHRRRPMHRTLAYVGPALLAAIVLVWVALLGAGWSLVFLAEAGSVAKADGGGPGARGGAARPRPPPRGHGRAGGRPRGARAGDGGLRAGAAPAHRALRGGWLGPRLRRVRGSAPRWVSRPRPVQVFEALASEGPKEVRDMLLRDKTAVVLGAGSIGGAVASAFAAEGARVGIVARSGTRLDALVRRIREAGGRAKAVRADALDEAELRTRTAPLFGEGGRVDIAFSAIGWDDVQGTPLVEMPLEPILHPVRVATQAQVVMAKVFAPPMIRAGAGVLMTITATPARRAFPRCGGFAVACAAVEGLTRSLAAELGPHGVRVVGLRSAGSPETIGEILEDHARGEGVAPAEFVAMLEEMTLLRRLPGLHDVGRMAAWLASEGARTLTGTTVNMTCGQVTD